MSTCRPGPDVVELGRRRLVQQSLRSITQMFNVPVRLSRARLKPWRSLLLNILTVSSLLYHDTSTSPVSRKRNGLFPSLSHIMTMVCNLRNSGHTTYAMRSDADSLTRFMCPSRINTHLCNTRGKHATLEPKWLAVRNGTHQSLLSALGIS